MARLHEADMKRRLRTMWICLLVVACALAAGAYLFLSQDRFGALPEGDRLARIVQSPQYVDGEFRNPEPLPPLKGSGGFVGALLKYVLSSQKGLRPPQPLPAIKTNLLTLDRNKDVVIWLGHSSYFVQFAGRRMLIDPVFSAYASPFSFSNKAFEGTSLYTAADMPAIDYLLISHDHWDHLDYPTVASLRPKVANVVCGLGVGAYFEAWDYAREAIHEQDWNTALEHEDGFAIHVLPARHYSGRALIRNKTLWTAFALASPKGRIFFSGDSGYGRHFAEIGRKFGGFDLAVLDSGQYDENWRYTHMMPEDAAMAAVDLRADALLAGHVGRFAIAYHTWDDPFRRLAAASHDKPYRLLTPVIGQSVNLLGDVNGTQQVFPLWWEGLAD